MNSAKRYWFHAKRYGWGWGLPATQQGWLVLGAYVAGLVLLTCLAPPVSRTGVFVAGMTGLSALFVAVCWLTGEPPRWRWGNER